MKSLLTFTAAFMMMASSIGEYAPVPDEANVCRYRDSGFTCLCDRDETLTMAYSRWEEATERRVFTQSCGKPKKTKINPKECDVALGNTNGDNEWEFHCPNNTYFATWGAFTPARDDHQIRLWYQCCANDCPNMLCQWSQWTVLRYDFPFDLNKGELFAAGVRGKHAEDQKDTSWSIRICQCDRSKEEL